MQELSGRVAVVTGAASGIGRGLAERFAAEGMKVVLADVEEQALAAAEADLAATGAEVLAVATDVSSRTSVDDLADASVERFGAVHVLCNNAGVSGGMGPIWQTTEADWQWVLGVNLMGVVHGVQAFVPGMVAHGEPGHVVNTSSVLGLSSGGGSIYSVSKHAVTRLSEGLYHDLRAAGAPVGVSVLCPGMIATRIVTADRNRPAHLRNPGIEIPPEMLERRKVMQERFLEMGMPPAEVAGMVVDAIRDDRFYVLTHPGMIWPHVEARVQAILADEPPAPGLIVGGIAADRPDTARRP
jgi:NAD(P)-dependent dehydrogenase (short-subunit alcohol dehydrogenase family)